MRTAEEIISDYRARGYSLDRLRALANGRPEPIRSEMLALLGDEPQSADEPAAASPASEIVLLHEEDDLPEAAMTPDGAMEQLAFALPESEETAEAASPAPEDAAAASIAEALAFEDDQPVADAQGDVIAKDSSSNGDAVCEIDEAIGADGTGESVAAIEAAELAEVVAMEAPAAIEEPSTVSEEAVHDILADAPICARDGDTAVMDDLRLPVLDDDILAEIEAHGITPVDEEAAQDIGAETEAAGWPKLAPLVVERVSRDEYARRSADTQSFLPVSESEPEEIVFFENTVAPAEAVAEAGQQADEAEDEAIVDVPAASQQSSALIAFCDENEEAQNFLLKAFDGSKAALRSLEVIRQAIEHEPELVAAVPENEDVITLNPWYGAQKAQAEAEEKAQPILHLMKAETDEAAKDESKLISFPSDMIPMYEAIQTSRPAASSAPLAPVEQAPTEEQQIESLRRLLAELEDEVNCREVETTHLADAVRERELLLETQAREIENLRSELALRLESLGSASDVEDAHRKARGELAEARARLETLEREHAILKQETVPNLMHDREDLVRLLEEQAAEKNEIEEALHASGRRVGLSAVLAAAACFMLVAAVTFNTLRSSSEARTFRAAEDRLLAELDAAKLQIGQVESSRDVLAHQVQQTRQAHAIDKQVWAVEQQKLIKAVEEKERELTAVRHQLASAGGLPTPASVAQDNQRAGIASSVGTNGGVQHNGGISNLQEWQQRREQASAGKTTTVQQGEGISQILWRTLGTSNSELVDAVARMNNLQKHPRGYYLIHPGQELKLPASANAVASTR